MKSSIITGENTQKHFVETYRFKVLAAEHRNESDVKASNIQEQEQVQNIISEPIQSMPLDPHSIAATPPASSVAGNESFVEELLKKVDELGDNVIKLQMQIENQESEFNARLVNETQRARVEGIEAGKAEAKASYDSELSNLNKLYSASILKLEEAANKLNLLAQKSESELGSAAIEIAREVIAREVSLDSSSIAVSLAKKLIAELANPSNITISVNPINADMLNSEFAGETKNIKIVPDDAIAPGGVIIVSDVGNLEAGLQTRLEKLKSMVG